MNDLLNIEKQFLKTQTDFKNSTRSVNPPKILLLYGSLRERSFSRLVIEECARLLTTFGCETRIYNPSGLPLPDDADESHIKVQELRSLMEWSEGQVWCSPERHGAITGIMKTQIDWIPLKVGAVRPTQGKPLPSCRFQEVLNPSMPLTSCVFLAGGCGC